MTDGATGRTAVWHAPPGGGLLSSRGAPRLARALPFEWTRGHDDFEGTGDVLRHATEARPVFRSGRLCVMRDDVPPSPGAERDILRRTLSPQDLSAIGSVLPDLPADPRPGLDATVVVDAVARRVVVVVDENDDDPVGAVRAFFGLARRGG